MEKLPEAEQAAVLEALGSAAAELQGGGSLGAAGAAAEVAGPSGAAESRGVAAVDAGGAAGLRQAIAGIPAAVRKGLEQAGAWDEELLSEAATALPRALPAWPDGAQHEADEEYVDGDDEHFQVSGSTGDGGHGGRGSCRGVASGMRPTKGKWV